MDLGQPAGDQVEGLLPAGLPEVRHHLVVVDQAARLTSPAALVPWPAAPTIATAATAVAALAGAASVVVGAAAAVAAHVRGKRTLRVGGVAPDQRHGEALRGRCVVPAVAALDAQPALRSRLVTTLGEGDRTAFAVDVVGQRTADAAVRADAVDGVQLLARPDRDTGDRLVRQRTGRAGLHAFPAGDARAGTHRVVQIERDPGGVSLSGAADHVVALDVVAGPHAPVTQDAGVVIDGDDRVGGVLPTARAARQVGGLARHLEAIGQIQQQVVRRRGLLRVLGARRLVGHQQFGEGRAAPFEFRGGRLHLHAVLAGTHARGGEHPPAGVDDAQPAHSDRVVAFVVAQHRDVDTGQLGRLVDRAALGRSHRLPVDLDGDRRNGGRRSQHGCHLVPRLLGTSDGSDSSS